LQVAREVCESSMPYSIAFAAFALGGPLPLAPSSPPPPPSSTYFLILC